jgi:hypothetical protein
MVIGGATGALVLSITFLENIAGSAPVVGSPVLALAWGSLLLCLFCALVSQFLSGKSFDCEIARLDARSNNEPCPANRFKAPIEWCTGIAFALLVAGIALLATFAFVNAVK